MAKVTTYAGPEVEAIIRAWRSTRPTGTPVPDVIRMQAAAFVERRGHAAAPRSLDHAIRDVRQRAPGWGAADFVYWSLWMGGSCDWARQDLGWIVKLVDAVFDALPAEWRGSAVFHAWKTGGFPQALLPETRWRELFNLPGYIDENTVTRRPSGSVTLYRGATHGCRRNWSWASTWGTAAIYQLWRAQEIRDAQENGDLTGLQPSAVWVARVPWSSVLARSRPPNPLDEEWVVDTENVKIKKFDDSPRAHHLPHCRMPRRARATPLGGPVRLGGRPMPGRCLECGVCISGYPR